VESTEVVSADVLPFPLCCHSRDSKPLPAPESGPDRRSSTASRKAGRFGGWGDYEDYGDFRRARGIRITGREEAAVVWDAFCGIRRKA
jgi:hypothetical protein